MRNFVLSVCAILAALQFTSCGKEDIPAPFNCANSTLTLLAGNVVEASGCDVSDGSIQVNATGGTGPFQYSINSQAMQSTGSFNNLKAGIYSVKVVDRNKCEAALSNILLMAEGLTVTTEIDPDNICLGGDGSITVVITDGHAPYEYKLEDGEFGEGNTFSGLTKGNHMITVKDNLDCTIQLNITVPHGNTGTSWSSQIRPIMQTKCSNSGCHDGVFQPDLSIYSQAKFHSASIKELTRNKSMPQDGSLTQDQIELITCWVDDGAPEN